MKLILLRHGETEWNASHRYQGHTDICLNDNGKKQAQIAAQYFKENESVAAIYCSDLSRSKETAEIIADVLNMEVKVDARLKELSFGIWEGMSFKEVYETYRTDFDQWYKDVWGYRIQRAETMTDVITRITPAIEEMAELHSGSVLVVTHGGVIKALLGHIDSGINIWEIDIPSCSISKIEVKRGVYIVMQSGKVLGQQDW